MSATVSTLLQDINIKDGNFVDRLDNRTLYQANDYKLQLTFLDGNDRADGTDLAFSFVVQSTSGEVFDIAGSWTTATSGEGTITVPAASLNFTGTDYMGLIRFNGSVVAEFPLIVKAYGTPAPAAGTVIDWSIYTGYTNTATDGPVRPDGSTLEVATTNADGSINLGVKDGVYRSVFDLLGTWDPVANSPTLTDGTGNEGDIYFIQGINGNTYSVDTGSGAQTYTARRFVRYASGVWIPEGDPNYVWQDYFAVSGYAFATGETVDATTEPSDWPSRIHFVTSSAGIAEGWPVDNALIVTSKATTARAVQMVYEFGVATPKAYFRSWDGATWTAFKQFAYDDDVVKLTPTPSTIQTLNGGSGFTQLNITGESGYLAVGRTTSGGEAVHVVRDETTSGSWQVGILTTAKESEHSAYEIYRNETGNLFVGFWVSQVDKLCRAVYGLVAPIIKSAEATGLVVQDSAGTEKLKVGASTGADVQVTGDLSVTEKQATVYSLSDSRDATMSGDETLTTASATNQYLDPADADRNLDLPNASVFIISNVGDGAEIITVRDEADATIDTIDNGVTLRFQWTGSAWRVS